MLRKNNTTNKKTFFYTLRGLTNLTDDMQQSWSNNQKSRIFPSETNNFNKK